MKKMKKKNPSPANFPQIFLSLLHSTFLCLLTSGYNPHGAPLFAEAFCNHFDCFLSLSLRLNLLPPDLQNYIVILLIKINTILFDSD